MSLDALAVAIRSGLYLDLMLLFGVAVFRFHALFAEPEPRARGTRIVIAALIGMLLSLIGLVVLAAAMSGTTLAGVDPGAILLLLRDTSIGTAGIVRLLALSGALLCGLFWRRLPLTASIGAVSTGGVALASLAWSGHGAMDEGAAGWVHLGADIIHLLAAGIWIGALAALLRLAVRRSRAEAQHLRRVHSALERFSAIGIAVVLLVLLSGLANGWYLIGPARLDGLLSSAWGRLLLAKLALFAAMLALAAINRFRLTRALLAPSGQTALRRLRLSLAVETAAAVLILLLVAMLGMLEPPISLV